MKSTKSSDKKMKNHQNPRPNELLQQQPQFHSVISAAGNNKIPSLAASNRYNSLSHAALLQN